MYRIILCFLVLLTIQSGQAQTTVFLSDPIQVADNGSYGRTRPRIAINRSGLPVVLWGQTSTDNVFVSVMNGGTGNFLDPIQINHPGTHAYVSSWVGPDIASYGDTVFVTYHSTPETHGYAYVHKSIDGGWTFGDSVRVDGPNIDQSRYPNVDVGPDGNPLVGFMSFTGNWIDPDYVVARSEDGGQTFETEVDGSWNAPGEVCDCCPSQVVVGESNQAILFRNNDNDLRDNWVSISADGGMSFPISADIDNNNWVINSCPASGPDGYFGGDTLYTVWMSEGSGDTRVNIASVNKDNGFVGYSGNLLPWNLLNANENFPRIDGEGQTMGIVYQGWSSGNTDCFILASNSGIGGLSDTVKLGGLETDGVQRNPDIAYHEGTFHVVYEDLNTGHLMYQQANLSGVGIQEFESLFDAWSSAPGEISFQADLSGSYSIELIDLSGRLIRNSTIRNGKDLISGLESGLYLVTIKSDGGMSSKKVLVQ